MTKSYWKFEKRVGPLFVFSCAKCRAQGSFIATQPLRPVCIHCGAIMDAAQSVTHPKEVQT